ncbi:MAG: cytochrome c biogenesis protein CcsA [Bacteroidaceae bacterium]
MVSRIIKTAPFLLLGIAALAIALATLVEASQGTPTAHAVVYGTIWFRLLWFAASVTGLYLIYKLRLWKRSMGVFFLHLALLVILSGALVTSVTSHRGTLHLRQGIPTNNYTEGKMTRSLPFALRLDTFIIRHYPGTSAPQDYVSLITLHPENKQVQISMNRIGRMQGYRLYQSSYDEDLHGSILSVTYDPWGTAITYAGYALLALCIIVISLPKRIRTDKRMMLVVMTIMTCLQTQAKPELPCINREKADIMEREQVVWNGRVAPMGTMCQEFLLKVYGKRSFQGLSATQVVCSMALSPGEWANVPLIRIARGEYRSLSSYINYSSTPPSLQNMDEADDKTREKVGLMLMLIQGTLFNEVPDTSHRLSPAKVSAELLYNRIDWTMLCMISAFVLALLLTASLRRKLVWCTLAASMLHGALTLMLTVLLAVRWYIAGHIPLSNGYETMLFVSFCLTGGTLLWGHRRLQAFGAMGAAFMLLVAHLGEINPQITPLMPVLHSPWLSAHVSIIMISYALLALSMVERSLLRPAVMCLAAGIFLGAVWANVSWGTYWSWDPKESWALVCLIVYSIPLHKESLPWFRKDSHYRLYSLLALACLLMTYFGVNYLLGGMHSYSG